MTPYAEPLFYGDPDYDGGTTPSVQQPGTPPVIITPPVAASPSPTPVPVAATPIAVPPLPTPRRAPTGLPVPVVVSAPRYSADDYAAAAKALLPRGRAWPDDPGSVQHQVLLGIGKAFERSDAALNGILAGSVPGSLSTSLPEWEATLGLPDPCVGATPTIDQRLQQVRGRFAGAGGQSRQHFIDFAATLGFTIQISVYKPGQAGLPPSDMATDSIGWMFTWGVKVLASTGALPVDVLMCELEAVKPAETTVLLLT